MSCVSHTYKNSKFLCHICIRLITAYDRKHNNGTPSHSNIKNAGIYLLKGWIYQINILICVQLCRHIHWKISIGSEAFDKFYQVFASEIPSKLMGKNLQQKNWVFKKIWTAFYKLISQNFDEQYVKNTHCSSLLTFLLKRVISLTFWMPITFEFPGGTQASMSPRCTEWLTGAENYTHFFHKKINISTTIYSFFFFFLSKLNRKIFVSFI